VSRAMGCNRTGFDPVFTVRHALFQLFGSCGLLTQHRTPRDSNSEGVLIPAGTLRKALAPHAGDVEPKTLVRHSQSLTP
jgi:hypothetical protein